MTNHPPRYTPEQIEQRWQERWERDGLYRAKVDPARPKYYALTMLPYPSGDLHIGHWYAMTPSDARARYLRMRGYNVMYPHLLRQRPAKHLRQHRPHGFATYFICARRSCRPPGTNRPNRLIRNYGAGHIRCGNLPIRRAHLPFHHQRSLRRFILRQILTHTNNRPQALRQHGCRLAPHLLIGLRKKLAPLRVPHNHILAKPGQHARGNLSRERTTFFRVHILRTKFDMGPA